MEELFNDENFHSLAELENIEGLNVTGLYAIRVKDISAMPELFKSALEKRNTNLIYIGKGNNIRQRLRQECRGVSHGTFFRSIGAILGYMPPRGSLIGMANQHNYRFSIEDREKIIAWINENLEFSFVEVPKEMLYQEAGLIADQTPLLNIQHNPQALEELNNLRNHCRQRALGICECKECKK